MTWLRTCNFLVLKKTNFPQCEQGIELYLADTLLYLLLHASCDKPDFFRTKKCYTFPLLWYVKVYGNFYFQRYSYHVILSIRILWGLYALCSNYEHSKKVSYIALPEYGDGFIFGKCFHGFRFSSRVHNHLENQIWTRQSIWCSRLRKYRFNQMGFQENK